MHRHKMKKYTNTFLKQFNKNTKPNKESQKIGNK